ncbi:hypothetical protein ZWY2020_029443 [Hordeum vulgare]|nr:hypothetical protein ZWY2020_029443 [Hordeum vulgare]
MPSWKDGEESSEEEELENRDTTIDASFYGRASDPSIKCRLHLAPVGEHRMGNKKIPTRTKTYHGDDGIDCRVAEWVDAPWPSILQRCLGKIWEMFHEANSGRDVTNMFDWEDQNNRLMTKEEVQQKQMDVDKDMEKLSISKEKEKATIENMKETEKLAEENKELKCIVRSQR